MPDHPDTLTMLEIFREEFQRAQSTFKLDPNQFTYAEMKYWQRKVSDFEFKKQARLSAQAGSASQNSSDASQQQ
jgi:hypothetical protein